MIDAGIIKVLLVEDDEDDYIITRDLLSEMPRKRVTLQWVKTFEAGLAEMLRNQHDVCLLDYRLGPHNGIELLSRVMGLLVAAIAVQLVARAVEAWITNGVA